jgi:tetratricopeptide (TPR) repeat protein
VEAAIAGGERTADAFRLRSSLRLQAKDYAGAAADLGKVLELEPGQGKLHAQRGFLLNQHLRDPQAALQELNRAIELGEVTAKVYWDRAKTRRGLRDPHGALDDYERSIELDGSNPHVFNQRGVVLDQLGRLEEALTAYAHTQTLEPGYVDGHDRPAQARPLRRGGRGDAALRRRRPRAKGRGARGHAGAQPAGRERADARRDRTDPAGAARAARTIGRRAMSPAHSPGCTTRSPRL